MPWIEPRHIPEGLRLLRAGINRSKRAKGKHSKNAPTCGTCRVTLSHGRCLNRMCDKFNQEAA